MQHSSEDPANLTPDQRRREIAAILARGILRLHSIRPLAPESATSGPCEDAPEIAENGLEVSATSRPHVTGS
jgi:hypothetical protein